jgi:hypothetical protein
MLQHRFESAVPFPTFVEHARENAVLWRETYRLARVSPEAVARLAALPGTWHFLVLVEDWCGDAVNTVPLVARLTELAGNADLRVLARDEHPDLMNAHLKNGSRSIPVVIVLDEDFVERGWWGPRPSPLQRWVMDEGMALEKDVRYRGIRTWYARDRGRTTLDEVVELVERAAREAASSAEACL